MLLYVTLASVCAAELREAMGSVTYDSNGLLMRLSGEEAPEQQQQPAQDGPQVWAGSLNVVSGLLGLGSGALNTKQSVVIPHNCDWRAEIRL